MQELTVLSKDTSINTKEISQIKSSFKRDFQK